MNIQRQRAFIIKMLYWSLIIFLMYLFFHTLFHIALPFFVGFFIAFLLRPMICFLTNYFKHEKLCSLCIILLFYTILILFIIFFSLKGFSFLQNFMLKAPNYYTQQIEPFLDHFIQTWSQVHEKEAQFALLLDSFQSSMASFISNFSSTMLTYLSKMASSLPNILFSLSMSLLSSFFFTWDYHSITSFIYRQFPMRIRFIVSAVQQQLRTNIKLYIIAYGKLMILTFIELLIGLRILQIPHFFLISFLIALFDFFPILGAGGILIPWIIISYVTMHQKLACGLLILTLIMTLIRNIMEPHIVGKQFNLPPLLMLAGMYIGAKLLGVIGMIITPFLFAIIRKLHEDGVFHLYK